MFINLIRSVLFNLHFYILTFLLVIIMFPVLILPFWFIKIIAKTWGKILVFGMKIWLGLNLKIIGNYNKKKPCIIAVKHQSAWETVICTSVFDMPSIVLKKELIYLPIIGLYFLKGRAIPIIRENTIESLKKIVKMAKVNLKKGDMLVYSGCELEHWREKFKGNECIQVFLHYNDRKTPGAKKNMFDRRMHLGLPNWFQR